MITLTAKPFRAMPLLFLLLSPAVAERPAPSRLIKPLAPSRRILPPSMSDNGAAPNVPEKPLPGALLSADPAVKLPDGCELITERYPDRKVRIQRSVKQDDQRNYVNHGPWTHWDPKGKVVAQGEFVNGKRAGQWFRILDHFPGALPEFRGPFTSQATFEAGKLQGVWTVVDQQNRIVGSWEFNQGILNGPATLWYPNGQQKQEMRFKNGVPDGEAIAWRGDGRIWAREFYRDGSQLIPQISWYDGQQKESEGWLLRDHVDWTANVDWWNGTIEVSRNETGGEDVRVGKWSEWHENGSLRYVGEFEDGRPVGEHNWWHENGQRMLTGAYEDGYRDGRWTMWHPNGQKQEEGAFARGVRDGEWIAWSETGEVVQIQQLAADSTEVDEELSLESEPFSHISLD